MKSLAAGFAASLVLFLGAAGPAAAGDRQDGILIDYHTESAYLPQTPGVSGGAVGAFGNPASWATNDRGELALWWNDASLREGSLDNWGFSSGRNLGFAMQRSVLGTAEESFSLYDYQIGLAGGNRGGCFGAAWRWAGGATGRVPRENSIVAGTIIRPDRWLSLGLSGDFSVESDARLGVADLGVRPFSRPWVTLFADYSLRDFEKVDGGRWGAGVELRPLPGIHLGMKLRDREGEDDYDYSLNFGITVDDGGFHVLPSYNKDGERRENGALRPVTYLARFTPPYSGIPLEKTMKRLFNRNRYVELDLHDKRLTYQTARFFDDRRIAWLDLARELREIRDDESIRGVAINLAGFSVSPALAWELRRELDAIREAGKEILVHVERPTIPTYAVACAADRITVDPQGDMVLAGLAIHRTYMKGALDKLGIGFEEWRYMKYKSAAESFSRADMSDADREQIGRMIDVIYEQIRATVCDSRELTEEEFDGIVEDEALLTAKGMVEARLVDGVARWHELGDWLGKERRGAKLVKPCYREARRTYHDDRWGRPPEISVVYAVGVCDMETGIRGRATSKALRNLATKRGVAGVVLRADSPGGDPLPSDLVADGMHMIRENGRSVVVSQGALAASGGYWISMPGQKILTTPLTITGSIGVIGGWVYDDGVSGKTGFSADGVQRGSHSDLFTGIRFPLLGRLPERPLDDKENAIVKKTILELYEDFKVEVAEARGIPVGDVQEIAQGRVWMGGDGIERGICDEYGGLLDAIDEARELAGIDPDDEVRITEFPKRKLFLFPGFGPSLPGGGAVLGALHGLFAGDETPGDPEEDVDYGMDYLKIIARSNGEAMLLLPPEAVPDGWYDKQ